MRAVSSALAVVPAITACGSFGSSSGETPADAGAIEGAPTADGGGTDGTTGTTSEGCPPDALLCHSFDGPLTPTGWSPDGAGAGSGLLFVSNEAGRTFARARVGAAGGAAEDRLRGALGAARNWVELTLDVRVTEIALTQKIEIASVVYSVSPTNDHYVHLLLVGGSLNVSEFQYDTGTPGQYRELGGKTLAEGWNSIKLRVEYGTKDVIMTTPVGNVTGKLEYLPPPGTTPSAQVKVGLVHADTVVAPFTYDIDSVVIRGAP